MSMMMLMAMATGLVTLPAPTGYPDRWLGPDDIPKAEFNAGKDGTFFFKLVVTPAGKVDQCKVLAATAAETEWGGFCDRVKRRFSYAPVTDHKGVPSHFVVEQGYAYVLPESWVPNAVKAPAYLELDVARLPGATDGKVRVPVNVAVDAGGALSACNAAPAAANNAALAKAACGQLQAQWAAMPEKNAAGQAVGYVRELVVEFRQQKAGG